MADRLNSDKKWILTSIMNKTEKVESAVMQEATEK